MDQVLIKMAKQSSRDNAVLAADIHRYGEREGLDWDEIASQLGIDGVSLAKIALCRHPRSDHFSEDTQEIAEYVGIDPKKLSLFLLPRVKNGPIVRKIKLGGIDMRAPTKYFAWASGIVVLLILILGAFVYIQPERSKATLVVLKGQATVHQTGSYLRISNPSTSQIFGGQVVSMKAGDTISLGPGGAAQLRFYDGSSMEISENSEFQITSLDTNQDSYIVRINLLSGKVLSRVIRVLEVGDAFEIKTPSSTVTVRGTVFTVAVISPQTTYVACEKGVVLVITDGKGTFVNPGEEHFSTSNQPPEIKPTEIDVQVDNQPTATGFESSGAANTPTPALNLGTSATSAPPNAVMTAEAGWSNAASNQTGNLTGSSPSNASIPSNPPNAPGGKPAEVPGKPPEDVPGKPPTGGSLPPGHGGSPPGLGGEKPPGHGGSPPGQNK